MQILKPASFRLLSNVMAHRNRTIREHQNLFLSKNLEFFVWLSWGLARQDAGEVKNFLGRHFFQGSVGKPEPQNSVSEHS